MKKITFIVALAVALGLIGCTALERQDIVNDVGASVQAPSEPDGTFGPLDGEPDYKPSTVAIEVGKEALQKADNPGELLLWAGGLIATVAGGWFTRKFIQKKYSKS